MFAALGEPRHIGQLETGGAAKLMLNWMLVASTVAIDEAISLDEALSLERTTTLDVLADSPIGPTVRAKRANVEAGQSRPSFRLSSATKDMRLVDQAAVTIGLKLPAGKAARVSMQQAVAAVAATNATQSTGSTGPAVIA